MAGVCIGIETGGEYRPEEVCFKGSQTNLYNCTSEKHEHIVTRADWPCD